MKRMLMAAFERCEERERGSREICWNCVAGSPGLTMRTEVARIELEKRM